MQYSLLSDPKGELLKAIGWSEKTKCVRTGGRGSERALIGCAGAATGSSRRTASSSRVRLLPPVLIPLFTLWTRIAKLGVKPADDPKNACVQGAVPRPLSLTHRPQPRVHQGTLSPSQKPF